MTVVVEETETTPAVEEAAPNELARWHIRAAAFVVDVLPGLAVVATMVLVWLAVPLRSAWWWLSVSVLAAAALLTMINRVVLPALSGWSLGRAMLGIAVVRPDGASVGVGRLLCRDLAHLLDTLSVFVGWLWPLWDPRRRTFADVLLRHRGSLCRTGSSARRHWADGRYRRVRRGAALYRRRRDRASWRCTCPIGRPTGRAKPFLRRDRRLSPRC